MKIPAMGTMYRRLIAEEAEPMPRRRALVWSSLLALATIAFAGCGDELGALLGGLDDDFDGMDGTLTATATGTGDLTDTETATNDTKASITGTDTRQSNSQTRTGTGTRTRTGRST